MNTNVGIADRIVRIALGAALIAIAIWSNYPYAWLGYIGVVPLLTAAFGSCPLYSLLGISTCPIKRA